MGVYASKNKSKNLFDKDVSGLMEKTGFLQKEMREMICEREKESKGYERDMMIFAFKEAEWKQERKRLRGEVKSLRKMVEEKEDKIRGMGEKKSDQIKEWEMLGTSFMVEQMREERARRDETVEKWKQLYLAIKMELDDLIQRTHDHGDVQYWRAEEEEEMMIEELQRELNAKEETIKALKARVASVEHEEYKKEREIDILRQSLRIMSSQKTASRVTKNLP
ncbi:E3 ubiquitin-protein ligase BRE1A-like [Juglans microcarpa x Juglans regia]|uniref:E3 ubiquitin-protein ligase BRE1A-like n=1 Tax=Juglans microcarpa x Juglans regia TaxID=2249226 RepID=UPI001B7DD2D7|nr:E3 ubiquitin-protein ligase BRE1A-like [Juglans microcarpa x Juglans regia]